MIFQCLVSILIGVSSASVIVKRATVQNPGVWDALDQLKGNSRGLSVDQIQELFLTARAGQDFPILAQIPQSSIDCAVFHQPGFYADSDIGQCQLFHRCDINGNLTSYLCPNMTLFNQITLVCDWWFNVDCGQAKAFADYSNGRLYQGQEVHLLDDQDVFQNTGAALVEAPRNAKRSHKRKMQKMAENREHTEFQGEV